MRCCPQDKALHMWCPLHSSDSSCSAMLNFLSAVVFSLTHCFYRRLTAGGPAPHAWYSYCLSSYGGAATSSWGLTGSRSDRVPRWRTLTRCPMTDESWRCSSGVRARRHRHPAYSTPFVAMHARRCCAFKAFLAAMTIPFVQNGTPFASTAIAGQPALSIWWSKLGVLPERIRPGHPEQNGRHERMHRTLKGETTDVTTKCIEPLTTAPAHKRETMNKRVTHVRG